MNDHFAYYDYFNLFLVVISIKVPAVGCCYNRGAVGKTHCSVVYVAPHGLFALCSQTSPQTHHHDTKLHFLLPPTLALSLPLFGKPHCVSGDQCWKHSD